MVYFDEGKGWPILRVSLVEYGNIVDPLIYYKFFYDIPKYCIFDFKIFDAKIKKNKKNYLLTPKFENNSAP